MDTVTVVVDNVTIKYSRTNQCYPSNEIFAFNGTATGLPSGALFNWDFGDGHTINGASSGTTVGNIYQTAGNYTVTLNITDANKNSLAEATVNLKAYGQEVSPHASFYAELFNINYPNNLNFNADGSTVTNGTITNYAWIWGDSTTTSSVTPDNIPHDFPQIPTNVTYPVKLIVTASSGCKDSAVVPVAISAVYSNISGDFDTLQVNPCTAEYFVFTPNAINVPKGATYTWDFGDATGTPTSTGAIQHTFTYQNTYDVKMYINMNGNVIYTAHKSVWTNGQDVHPTALFYKVVSYEDSTYVKWNVYAAGISPPHGYIASYAWYLDNVLSNPPPNTTITSEYYPFSKGQTASTHTATLIVTSNVGCQDTASATLFVPIIGQYTN